MAKVSARRLSVVIGKSINEDQVGYVKGRNISSVIRTIDGVIGYLNMTTKKQKQKSGYLLALEYQKAFHI